MSLNRNQLVAESHSLLLQLIPISSTASTGHYSLFAAHESAYSEWRLFSASSPSESFTVIDYLSNTPDRRSKVAFPSRLKGYKGLWLYMLPNQVCLAYQICSARSFVAIQSIERLETQQLTIGGELHYI